jgi:hypothetical protein
MSHRGSRGIALPFLYHGTRRGWGVSVMPWLLFTPGKDPIPIVQEAGWDPGTVWTDVENLTPTGIRSLDRPARSQSLYWLQYPAHYFILRPDNIKKCVLFQIMFSPIYTAIPDINYRFINDILRVQCTESFRPVILLSLHCQFFSSFWQQNTKSRSSTIWVVKDYPFHSKCCHTQQKQQ